MFSSFRDATLFFPTVHIQNLCFAHRSWRCCLNWFNLVILNFCLSPKEESRTMETIRTTQRTELNYFSLFIGTLANKKSHPVTGFYTLFQWKASFSLAPSHCPYSVCSCHQTALWMQTLHCYKPSYALQEITPIPPGIVFPRSPLGIVLGTDFIFCYWKPIFAVVRKNTTAIYT